MATDNEIQRAIMEVKRLNEKLAVLNGERDKTKAAIRANMLVVLGDIPAEMQTKTVTAAPTASDFNKLVNDVQAIYAKLVTIGQGVKAI